MTSHILLVKPESPERARFVEALDRLTEGDEPPVVVTAGDSREALHLAGSQPFDLVIADLVLPKPGLSGAETLIRLCEMHPAARTLLVSSHGYVRDLVQGTADAFLDCDEASPEQLEELTRSVTCLIAESGDGLKAIDEVTTIARPHENDGPPSAEPRHRRLIAEKYLLGKELGSGGMGVVYQAEDTFIGRPVAIKLLRMQTRNRDGLARRMRREIMIAGRLDHPNIVTIFDAGFEGDQMYFVMELIEGQTLRQRLRESGPLPRDEAVAVMIQTLQAVSYAHRQQVVHRDLKPENILLPPTGKVKVVDFGVAKMVSLAAPTDSDEGGGLLHTRTRGAAIGTRGYMAPEQVAGEEIDHRADIYALGVVLYEMIAGRPPFAKSARFTPPLEPGGLDLPGEPQLSRILRTATAARADQRYASGEELAAALERLATPSWKRFVGFLRGGRLGG